jgi:hypothetical protein
MPKLLFLVTEDWYFCSHRLVLATEAKRHGYNVVVATRVEKHRDRILSAGLKLIPITLVRNGRNPWTEFLSICELVRIYRSERPDLVHHVALKPVVYGSLARDFRRPEGRERHCGHGICFCLAKLEGKGPTPSAEMRDAHFTKPPQYPDYPSEPR